MRRAFLCVSPARKGRSPEPGQINPGASFARQIERNKLVQKINLDSFLRTP
jgi:hypothetical protein